MNNRIKARRYAEALYEVAKERNREEAIAEELKIVKAVFHANSDLISFIQNPKQWLNRPRIIKSTFTTFSAEVVKTLLLMVEHHAETEVEAMVDHYNAFLNHDRCIAVGNIYTVEPLAEQEMAEISTKFAHKFGYKALKLENVIDPNVIGGFKIIVDQRLYDASVQGRINEMKREFIPLHKR
ncbi:F0F1 ATP synthase subunit delta [Amphibacillus sediminis]|uniref:F0F1 ATP synthase subunit delta n=1 Tax=Amphibacillus sediminis TaxID=360185 RepID=UPI00082CE686|nr:F0F1 ATP synthase subunit delta [Amphibacillus sediminis]